MSTLMPLWPPHNPDYVELSAAPKGLQVRRLADRTHRSWAGEFGDFGGAEAQLSLGAGEVSACDLWELLANVGE